MNVISFSCPTPRDAGAVDASGRRLGNDAGTVRGLRSAAAAAGLVAASALMSGCVFESPRWAQTFATTTDSIPIQTWTTDSSKTIKIECAKAYHGGLYDSPPVWIAVTTITPSTKASYDTKAGVIYSAGQKKTLPASCWHADEAYSPAKYMTALRATQATSGGGTTTYRVFDLTGLECMGRENGKAGSWFAWISKNCALTYSNSTTLIPYVRIIANALGAASSSATAAPADLASPAATRSSNEAVARSLSGARLQQRFESETADAQWAQAAETRLRHVYDRSSPAGTQLRAANCRQSMCRVEVHHADAAAQERFVAALAPAGLFSNDGLHGKVEHRIDREAITSVYYMAREGTSFEATR